MRSFIALFTVLASVAFAQDLTDIPPCMTSCMVDAPLGACGSTDLPCLCGNQDFSQAVTACIIDSCESTDIQKALDTAVALCESAGAPIPDAALQSVSALASAKIAGETGSSESDETPTASEAAPQTSETNAASGSPVGAGVAFVGMIAGAVLAI